MVLLRQNVYFMGLPLVVAMIRVGFSMFFDISYGISNAIYPPWVISGFKRMGILSDCSRYIQYALLASVVGACSRQTARNMNTNTIVLAVRFFLVIVLFVAGDVYGQAVKEYNSPR